jgi:hypothetical protein
LVTESRVFDIINNLKEKAIPISKEYRRIIETLFDFSDYYDPMTNGSVEMMERMYLGSLQNFCNVVLVYSGVKSGGEVYTYDVKRKDLLRVPRLYCNEKIEDLLNCLKLYYLKNSYESYVDFLFTKNKNSLNSLLNHIPAKSPNDHRILGRFFGYPECCIEAMATENSVYGISYDREVLFATQYFKPCKPNCSEVKRLGKKWVDTIQYTYGNCFADILVNIIASRMLIIDLHSFSKYNFPLIFKI